MKTEIDRWWSTANNDVEKAEILFRNGKYDGTTFFCQQAVEKGLKALQIKQKNRFEKIHDLVKLGEDVGLPEKFLRCCKELT